MAEEKDKGGRPPKVLTEEQIEQVERLARYLPTELLAGYFGMGKTTFYEVLKRQPEVSERYKKGKAAAVSEIASTLVSKAIDGDMTAAIFYLKTRGGYTDKTQVDNISSDGSMSPSKPAKEMTDEELARIINGESNND